VSANGAQPLCATSAISARSPVDTVGEAFAATAIGLARTPLVMLLARGAAEGHARLAARILGRQSQG
jgi:hypothetical protein